MIDRRRTPGTTSDIAFLSPRPSPRDRLSLADQRFSFEDPPTVVESRAHPEMPGTRPGGLVRGCLRGR